MNFELVVAADEKLGIGKNGDLPWDIPTDLQYFAEVTTETTREGANNAVVMGRKTWESIPEDKRPLKNRVNLILTHQKDYQAPEGVLVANSLEEAMRDLSEMDQEPESVFIIGGGQIFDEVVKMPECQRIFMTKVYGDFNCDTFFPNIDESQFELTEESEVKEENGTRFQFQIFERI